MSCVLSPGCIKKYCHFQGIIWGDKNCNWYSPLQFVHLFQAFISLPVTAKLIFLTPSGNKTVLGDITHFPQITSQLKMATCISGPFFQAELTLDRANCFSSCGQCLSFQMGLFWSLCWHLSKCTGSRLLFSCLLCTDSGSEFLLFPPNPLKLLIFLSFKWPFPCPHFTKKNPSKYNFVSIWSHGPSRETP